ncbi:MAG: hypothetical protein JWO57_2176 [Pseudonocardiales bacterium]|nr:hypothetical protein [Pseudonocardiales bacterium]
MNRPWWAGLAPVSVPLDCAGHAHRLAWVDGDLNAPDHPDADRELTLVALGSASLPCLDLLDAWRRHTDDLDVLVLGSRGLADPLAPPDDGQARWTALHGMAIPSRAAAFPAGSRGNPDGVDEVLARLLRLDGELSGRLVATVIATWADRVEAADPRVDEATPALRAAVYGRLVPLVRGWLDEVGVEVDVALADPEGPVTGRRDGNRVVFDLPFSWLRDVWIRGLAVSDELEMLVRTRLQP